MKPLANAFRVLERIFSDPNLGWDEKFDAIFSDSVSGAIRKGREHYGVALEYYDPDTTYQEDVTAYYNAAMEIRERLLEFESNDETVRDSSPNHVWLEGSTLRCSHCGDIYVAASPCNVEVLASAAKMFGDIHKSCTKKD